MPAIMTGYGGYRDFDDDVDCYWLGVTDVDWAKTLVESHNADPNWPNAASFPDSTESPWCYRRRPVPTKLLKAAEADDLAMADLLM